MGKKALLKVERASMQYPGTLALSDTDLEVYAGEVLGLVGENGAGKSTLMKIISGVETASSGSMEIHGAEYKPRNTIEANRLGVGMVFQEQSLIQNLTVAQNMFIGKEDAYVRRGLIDTKRMNADTKRLMDEMEIKNIRPSARVSRLDFASRQIVEIAKVIHSVRDAEKEGAVILLDEPTSVLSEQEVQQLFSQIRRLCQRGNAVIFVSHKLDEVMEISDRVCVLKDGRKVAEMDTRRVDEGLLYELMVGKTASGEYYQVARQREPDPEVVLELNDLCRRGYFGSVNMKLHRGEIVSICGVIGSGKENLCAVVCGDEAPTSGEIRINGSAKQFSSPHAALRHGILSVPRERRAEGVVADFTTFENICMSNYDKVTSRGLISDRLARKQAEKYVKELEIKLPSVGQKVSNLSGGNAQKVVFARVLASEADILVLDHPTRGVDVGAKAEIYSIIRDIANDGKSILLLGDTLDETIGLGNRVFVMKDGMVTKVFEAPPGGKPEQLDIVKYMM